MLYQIKRSKQSTVSLSESNGVCINASESFDWAVSLSFEYVRSYCERKGYTIVPTLEDTPCTIFEFHNSTYQVCWQNGRIAYITKDGEEINWAQLPVQLKGLL